ncbi:FkbM family methyltransferase [Pontibacter sp. HSC-36F09]|uniref:FkbM family methyltransferase n=1 Tax=Pontibacter sp. HSC-36F09 TaxID=2910966 RepID=UPI0020A1624D|nr:FkbM family methyltransferase [Pontibacter sp. HSC-36F09]MCP2044198.1 FkbM family methyltransferase [Pontibacter sp. HSC-36F09]
MLTFFRLWKLAFSRQNTQRASRMSTFLTLLRIYAQAKFSKKTDGPIQLQLEGFTVSGYSYATLTELYTDIFIKQVYRFESTSTQPFIVDCGANIGMAVLYFKQLYPDSEVWAYEANPDAFALLQQNVAANKLKGVRLFNYVLSDTDGEVDFYIPAATAGLNGSLNPSIAKGTKQRLPAYRLSGLLPENRVVDFVKVDIEGAEFKLLSDLSESGRLNDIQQLVVELHASSEEMQQKYNRMLHIFGTAYKHEPASDQYTLNFPHVVKFTRKALSYSAHK